MDYNSENSEKEHENYKNDPIQKVDTPRLLKVYIMFCLPLWAKYPLI